MSAPDTNDDKKASWAHQVDEGKALRAEAAKALADFNPDVVAMYDELFGIDGKKADKELLEAMKFMFE